MLILENVPQTAPPPDPREYVDETRLAIDEDTIVLEIKTEDGALSAFRFHPKQTHLLSDQLLNAYAETLRRKGAQAEGMEPRKTA